MKNVFLAILGRLLSKEELYIRLHEIKSGDLNINEIFESSDDKFTKFLKLQEAVRRFHVGLDVHFRVYSKLFRLIYNHYSRYDMEKINQQNQYIFKDTGDNVAIEGFYLHGVSGVGKTSLFSLLQKLFGNYVFHKEYNYSQISVLLVNCPTTGSVKNLCLKIFHEIDKLVGSSYASDYEGSSTEAKIMGLSQQLQLHKVGILILDEAHNITTYRSTYKDEIPILMKNLPNEISIPVVYCGDDRIFQLFDNDDMQVIRRGTGNGIIELKPMGFTEKNNRLSLGKAWDVFFANLRNYVFVKDQLLNENKLKLAYLKYSGGIPGIALILHTAILERLVNSSDYRHEITEKLIKLVAEEDLPVITSLISTSAVNRVHKKKLTKQKTTDNTEKEIYETKNKKNGLLVDINKSSNSTKEKIDSLNEKGIIVPIKELQKNASILS